MWTLKGIGLLIAFILNLSLGEGFNLTLLHTNDVHAHFIEFNTNGGRCNDELKKDHKCFGGFPRQVTKVKEIKANHDNVLFLNGGDFYQGTVWYTLHRWNIEADLVNTLGIDAMSLGNHEFDDGLKGLYPYLRKLKTKVVVCNINASKVPEFAELVKPSTIIEVAGEKIGIIGYLTPETKFLSSAGELEFEDEVECIKREAHRLATEEGLTKIFAVGHSGFAVDQNIAREVPEIDIVVGGHTNTFLYTGEPPSVEVPQGPYPVVIERADGSKALVVQDFAYGKYMGFLEVEFDSEGRVQHWSGNPILLDSSVEEDPEIVELLEPYGQEVKHRVRQSVGYTNVLLQGDRAVCRMEECNLGNFLADASLSYFIEKPTEEGWNFVAVALWNSGGIRSTIDEKLNGGNITFEDVITVAPFGNTMDVVALKGKYLKEALEFSMKDYDLDSIDPPGSFLQVSGLSLKYNVSNPVGSRLVKAYVKCADCRIPKFEPLDDEKVYWVVMNTYMTKGGDGFEVISKNALANRNTDELDVDILIKYIEKHSPVITGLEKRITVVSNRDPPPARTPYIGEHIETKLGPVETAEMPATENAYFTAPEDWKADSGEIKLGTPVTQVAPSPIYIDFTVPPGLEDNKDLKALLTWPPELEFGKHEDGEEEDTGVAESEKTAEAAETSPKSPLGSIVDRIGTGVDKVRTDIRQVGDKLREIPAVVGLPTIPRIFGRRD